MCMYKAEMRIVIILKNKIIFQSEVQVTKLVSRDLLEDIRNPRTTPYKFVNTKKSTSVYGGK